MWIKTNITESVKGDSTMITATVIMSEKFKRKAIIYTKRTET